MHNLYTAYNLSHFVIDLPKIIKIYGNVTKFWQKQFCTAFSETRCVYLGPRTTVWKSWPRMQNLKQLLYLCTCYAWMLITAS